jgi:4-hydroxybenzoate polyprenyltransferase
MEDMNGDMRYGCKQCPSYWGVNATKVYVAVWLIVLMAALVILQAYVIQFEWWWPIVYSTVLIILPLAYFLYLLYQSKTEKDFHQLSNTGKNHYAYWNCIHDILQILSLIHAENNTRITISKKKTITGMGRNTI